MSDQEALSLVKQVHSDGKYRFASECLEILLRKHFLESSNYLIDSYYTGTMIDTEVIVRKVESDIEKQQNKIIYSLLETTNKNWPPVAEPITYYAQSREAVYIKVKFAEDVEAAGCSHSFNHDIDVQPTAP